MHINANALGLPFNYFILVQVVPYFFPTQMRENCQFCIKWFNTRHAEKGTRRGLRGSDVTWLQRHLEPFLSATDAAAFILEHDCICFLAAFKFRIYCCIQQAQNVQGIGKQGPMYQTQLTVRLRFYCLLIVCCNSSVGNLITVVLLSV